MPELPDLQIFSKNLKKILLNKKINSVKIFSDKLNASVGAFNDKLIGTSICDIVRQGKELRFLLENGNSFNVHLMLNGKFNLHNAEDLNYVSSMIIAIVFEDQKAFTVSDYQGLCKISLNSAEPRTPDALSEKFTFDYFVYVASANKRKNIKALIIDQNIVRGIGNAYADEILFEAGISPESIAGKIPGNKLKELYNAIGSVLNDAIESIERISPEVINKEERSFLKVHNSKISHTEAGDPIRIKKVLQKITYYTDKQELYQ